MDEIILVCIEGWENVVEEYAAQHGITKLTQIILGGQTVQQSIRNGVFALEGKAQADDIVIVHDSVRPIVDREVLSDVIRVARETGTAVTAMSYNEQIFEVAQDDPETTTRFIPRETIRRVSTPQAYRFDLLDTVYHEAFEKGIAIEGSHYTNTMMVALGHRLHFALGSDRNIKLTTPDDLETFKAWVSQSEKDWF